MGRFANLSRLTAAGVFVLLAALIALGLGLSGRPTAVGPVASPGDIDLYRAVVERVRKGESYEAAAVAEHRARQYPLRPFVVVRPPTLATALSWLPDEKTGDLLLALLGAVVIAAWGNRLRAFRPGRLSLAAAVLTLVTGVGVTLVDRGGVSLLHETWAGLLIALSLALRTERRFAAAVCFGLLAALIRELALPYLAVMALIALIEQRRLEAMAFSAALMIALASLVLHARALSLLLNAHDPSSTSWVTLGGWEFVLATAKWNVLVIAAGSWAAAVIVPLALVGALAWKDAAGLRLTALLVGYTLGFMVVGRPENDYWGLITAPLAAVGLCFAPAALGDLFRRLIRG